MSVSVAFEAGLLKVTVFTHRAARRSTFEEAIMGLKADETIQLTPEELLGYLRSKTRVFMDIDEDQYYITHTDGYWRVQDCSQMNEKGRFSDCSELVPTLSELFELPWRDGKSVHDLCTEATFFESVQDGWEKPE